MSTVRRTSPQWHLLPTLDSGDIPNKSATHVMPVRGKGILVRTAYWSLGSLSVAVTFIPGAELEDFGITEVL